MASTLAHLHPLGCRLGALTLTHVIGKGASAVVYQSRSQDGEQYAVKVIQGGPPDLKRRKRVIQEISLHTLVSTHPNILPLLDAFSEPAEGDAWPRHTFLILPYASSGDLYSLILDHKRYLNNPSLIKSIFLQVLSAVQHCHSLGVFHRDIKSENILTFDEGRKVMLADFGLATTHARSREWGVGTVTYMSPECIGGSYKPNLGYSPAANDVWSLGILLVNLLTGRNPWHKATETDKSFVKYCQDPCNYLVHGFPISWQANAAIRFMFVAEDHRPDLATLIMKVEETKEWYHADAVFEGAMARWREPEDYVGRNGWVCREPEAALTSQFSDELGYFRDQHADTEDYGLVRRSQSGSSVEPATPCPRRATKPPRLMIRNPAPRDVEFLDSPPPLSSASSLSGSLPQTPSSAQYGDAPSAPKTTNAKEVQGDPFRWIYANAVRENLLPARPQRAAFGQLHRSRTQF